MGRRGTPAWALATVVAGGIGVSRGEGPVPDLLGGVLYAVAVFLVLALVRPEARSGLLAVVTMAICTAVELAQLTPVPAAVVETAPPLRYLLGTTFHAPDLAAYLVGSVIAYAADRLSTRARHEDPGPDHRTWPAEEEDDVPHRLDHARPHDPAT